MTVAAGIGMPACAGTTGNNSVVAPADQGTHTIMHFTKDQLDAMQNAINTAPQYSAPQRQFFTRTTSSLPGSVSLLSYLPYIPSQRDQGNCGNCWVWASNGALEIEHNVNNGISDRLSIQYVNSKYQDDTGLYACLGGYVQNFTEFYNADKSPIPWTNTNASYGDYHPKSDGSTAVPISSIATSPSYTLDTLSNSTVVTFGVGNSTAIANIRAALDSHHPVLYFFYLPSAGWDDFITFWSGSNTSMFDTSRYNAQEIYGGHGVLIVGYDTTDPDNPYWLVVNSWGVTTNRTDGMYRLNMTMNYDAVAYESGSTYQQNEFQILTPVFSGTPAVPIVSSVSPGSGPVAGGSPVTITGIGFTGATNVTFGSTGAVSFTKVTAADDSQITAIAPAGTAGTVHIAVSNTHGTSAATTSDQYTYTTPAPDPATDSGDNPGPSTGTGASVATAPGVSAGQTMTFTYTPQSGDGAAFQILQVQAVPSERVGEVALLVDPVALGNANQVAGNQDIAGYRQIEPIGVNPAVFSSGVISFRVTGSWLSAHQGTPDQLVMLRNHDGVWTELATTYVREDGNYYYFTADTPGFSYFAVAVRNTTEVTSPSTTVTVPAETTLPAGSAPAVSAVVQTSVPAAAGTSHPGTSQTTAAPAPAGSSGFPVSLAIAGAGAIVIVAVGIVVFRRWWIRRQNPALFRKCD
jgi:PGF-pre-PGF domain-containing protein